MKHCVVALLLLNLMYVGCDSTAVSKQNAGTNASYLKAVQNTWNDLLEAMATRDEEELSKYATKQVVDFLGGDDETFRGDLLEDSGKLFQSWERKWEVIETSQKIELRTWPRHSDLGPHRLVFKSTTNGWKLDEFHPGD